MLFQAGRASQNLSPPFKRQDLNMETWTIDFVGLIPYPKLHLRTEFDAPRVNNSRLTASHSFNRLSLSASFVTFLHPQSPFRLIQSKEQVAVSNNTKFTAEQWIRLFSSRLTPINCADSPACKYSKYVEIPIPGV